MKAGKGFEKAPTAGGPATITIGAQGVASVRWDCYSTFLGKEKVVRMVGTVDGNDKPSIIVDANLRASRRAIWVFRWTDYGANRVVFRYPLEKQPSNKCPLAAKFSIEQALADLQRLFFGDQSNGAEF